eukprot:scaffold85665_cov40-Prasinocladus_malaysianus.AAC.2
MGSEGPVPFILGGGAHVLRDVILPGRGQRRQVYVGSDDAVAHQLLLCGLQGHNRLMGMPGLRLAIAIKCHNTNNILNYTTSP